VIKRVSVPRSFASISSNIRQFSYSNQNKPESKKNVNEDIGDAKAGKTRNEVNKHRAESGGKSMAGETAKSKTDETSQQGDHKSMSQPSDDAVNRPDAGPDVIRQSSKNKK